MKALLFVAAVALTGGITVPANARDDRGMYSIDEALQTPEAQSKISNTIKLHFGDRPHPKVAKILGEWKTNKKTNAFNKSDKEACQWVFISAILSLQERALKEGGDAVINIVSNYKNTETRSDTEFMCGAGGLMAGVAFKGTVVKLATN